MRLIRCRKCGTVITTNDTLMQVYMDKIEELGRLAIKDKKNTPVYMQQAASLRKIVQQILHLTAQTDEHNRRLTNEIAVLNNYIREHNLIPDEKLWELRDIARAQAAQRIAEDEKKIEMLYGDFNSILADKSRKDPTESAALKGSKGKRKEGAE